MIFNYPSEQEQIDRYLEKFNGVVEVTKKHPKRSGQQNKYLHACIGLFAIETGYTLDEMKQILKSNCPFMRYTILGSNMIFLKSTAQLNSKEMTDFIEWMKNFAGQSGYMLPSVDDYNRNWVEIERTIEKQKTWL